MSWAASRSFHARVAGATRLYGISDSLFTVEKPAPDHVHVSAAAADDLKFWIEVLHTEPCVWDGVKWVTTAHRNLVTGELVGPNGTVIFTDAGGMDFGGPWGPADVQAIWSENERSLHMAWLDLSSIVGAYSPGHFS